MNLQPGEIAEEPEHAKISLETIFEKGMPGRIVYEYENGDNVWIPCNDLLELFTKAKFSINDPSLVWQPWDIIGFSILDATIEYDISKINKARALAPKAILVGGGSQATLNYQTLFD